jgi:hypothetical protein
MRKCGLKSKHQRDISFLLFELEFYRWMIAFLNLITFYSVIPTQFGHVPDVAFEEIRQIRNQQQQEQPPASLPFYAPTFVSTTTNNTTANNNNLYQSRSTTRELPANNSSGTVRARSLAPNTATRQSVVAASTNVSNPAYQTPLFATNKQTYLTPTRFGISRLNPGPSTQNIVPPGPSSSSNSYASNRSLPISTSPNIKHRTNQPHHYHNQQQATVSAALSNPSATSNGQQRSHYETTYRSSFIKPLVP